MNLAWRIALVSALLASSLAEAARDCPFIPHRHERRVSEQMRRETYRRTGIPWTERHCCVVDHIVPLELGGDNSLDNLQVQTKEEGKAKDRIENFLARCVCAGLTDWDKSKLLVVTWASVDPGGACP